MKRAGLVGILHHRRFVVGAGVDEDQVAHERDAIGGDHFIHSVGAADRIDDLEFQATIGELRVLLGESADAFVKWRTAAVGHDPFHRLRVLLHGIAGEVAARGGGQRIIRVAAQVDALIVMKGEVVRAKNHEREQQRLECGERADAPAVERAGGLAGGFGFVGHWHSFSFSNGGGRPPGR